MGLSNSPSITQKFFLLTNYILIGAATSCIFLTLSLRLLPSAVGLLLILLHFLAIVLAISSCSSSSTSTLESSARWHAAHMASSVMIAVFQGAVALLVFSKTDDFLSRMKSYVQEEDGVVILRMVGVLGLVVFALEWVVLVLSFVMRFYVGVEGGSSARVGHEEKVVKKEWLPFQVV